MTRIHTIDLLDQGTPGSIAAYLVEDGGEPVLIETGPSATFAALEAGLARLGLRVEDVRHALVTHIHFDHAGAAGHLARRGATIYVHEFGARHLIDPSRLVASARRIYGEQMDARWGPILPVPAGQIRSVHDGDVLTFGAITLRAIETPGHARHHHAYALETDDGTVCFTGDVAAAFVPGCAFISLPTPPPEFDLEQWLGSIDRLDRSGFVRLYPTHFGVVADPGAHLERVRRELIAHTALIRSCLEQGVPEERIRAIYRQFQRELADGLGLPPFRRRFYASDAFAAMNVTGILRFLRKSESAPTSRAIPELSGSRGSSSG